MNRSEILSRADTYVNNDRNTQYGEPEDAFGMIADLWVAYLDGREENILPNSIDSYDVACMLGLMKVARMSRRPMNPDSCVDLAGYAACAGEILNKINLRRSAPSVPQPMEHGPAPLAVEGKVPKRVMPSAPPPPPPPPDPMATPVRDLEGLSP